MMRRFIITFLWVCLSLAACSRPASVVQDLASTQQPSPDASLLPVVSPSASPNLCDQVVNDTILPPEPDDPRSYIGHHYDELHLPEGLVFNGGGVLNDTYLWEWVSRPDFDMHFLSQTLCYDSTGVPYNIVVDAIKIPRAAQGYGLADVCSNVERTGFVIVFGKFDKTQPETALLGRQGWKMYDMDFAQQINLQTRRFEPLPLDGVECLRMSGLGS